ATILSDYWAYMWSDIPAYYDREPLAHLLVWLVWRGVHDVPLAFRIVDSLWGGLCVAILCRFSIRPAFLAPNLLTAITLNFIGHVEYYAAVAASLTLFFYLLTRAIEPGSRVRPWHVVVAYGLAYLCHKMAFIFFPALFWLLVERHGGRWARRFWPGRAVEWAILCIIGFIVLDMLPATLELLWPGHLLVVTRDDKLLELLTPLTPAMARAIAARSHTGVYFLFSMGQWLHWKHFLLFALAGAPLGWPVLAVCWRRLRALQGFGRQQALALASAALLGVTWVFVWHPHMGMSDWDLFALGVLPVNLLAGGLWAGIFSQGGESGGA
ncbi:MAG: hypothetical protein M1457_00335, partial [bacterium]|nr:hypothetical protein [bacterium]